MSPWHNVVNCSPGDHRVLGILYINSWIIGTLWGTMLIKYLHHSKEIRAQIDVFYVSGELQCNYTVVGNYSVILKPNLSKLDKAFSSYIV